MRNSIPTLLRIQCQKRKEERKVGVKSRGRNQGRKESVQQRDQQSQLEEKKVGQLRLISSVSRPWRTCITLHMMPLRHWICGDLGGRTEVERGRKEKERRARRRKNDIGFRLVLLH